MAFKYKWKPNATQRQEFAERMKDDNERESYLERKRLKHSYEGFKDKSFIPTEAQYNEATRLLHSTKLNTTEENHCNMVISGYTLSEPIHHEHIHFINSSLRGELGKIEFAKGGEVKKGSEWAFWAGLLGLGVLGYFGINKK